MIEPNTQCFSAFIGHQLLATGPLAEVAIAVHKASGNTPARPIIIFDDGNGRPIDLDLRGSEQDVIARLPQPAPASQPATDGLVRRTIAAGAWQQSGSDFRAFSANSAPAIGLRRSD